MERFSDNKSSMPDLTSMTNEELLDLMKKVQQLQSHWDEKHFMHFTPDGYYGDIIEGKRNFDLSVDTANIKLREYKELESLLPWFIPSLNMQELSMSYSDLSVGSDRSKRYGESLDPLRDQEDFIDRNLEKQQRSASIFLLRDEINRRRFSQES
jgi:hypothetical protein